MPVAAWCALAGAAWADPGHDPQSDYVSWLSDGPYAPLAAGAILGLALSALLEARFLARTLRAGTARQTAVTGLLCSAVLAAATVALPSRGHGEPLWRTASHVGLAVGAYTGIVLAAAALALEVRRRAARGAPMQAMALLVVGSLALLALASGIARFTPSHVELRGLAQLALVASAAAWLTACAFVRSDFLPPTAPRDT